MGMPAAAYLHTGQIECRDARGRPVGCARSGQDAELRRGRSWQPQQRFRVQGETVLDAVTGLSWMRDAGIGEFPNTWQEALDFVAQLNRERALGQTDWRLPNRRELRSLISHQTCKPALPQPHPFQNLFQGWYWSSTTAVISPAHAWYVDMAGGRMFYGGKDQSFMVWPVRGLSQRLPVTGQRACFDAQGRVRDCSGSGQDGAVCAGRAWPEPRFAGTEEGALDRLTGLCWHSCADLAGSEVDWCAALDSIEMLNQGAGQRLWRLPNINELESLVDCSRSRPALAAAPELFDWLGTVYWSSTTSMYEPDWAWALYLDKGAVGVGHKLQAAFSVWPVRDAPAGWEAR
jgi:hypothetical protein